MSDREALIDRFVDGNGSAAFSLREWIALKYIDRAEHRRTDFFPDECRRLGKTPAELMALADLTTVYAEAKFVGRRKRREFYVTGYIYEIEDSPTPTFFKDSGVHNN